MSEIGSEDRVHLAVSRTDDPTGPWFVGSIDADEGEFKGPGATTFGLDSRGVYWRVPMGGNPATRTVFAADKAPLLADPPAFGTVTAFRDVPYGPTLVPALHATDGAGAYLVETAGNARVRVRRVDPPLTDPTLVDVGVVHLSKSWSAPPPVPTKDGDQIDAGDGSIASAIFRDGSLWATHCIETAGRASFRYYELDPVALEELQIGTVRDDRLKVQSFFNPSITARPRVRSPSAARSRPRIAGPARS